MIFNTQVVLKLEEAFGLVSDLLHAFTKPVGVRKIADKVLGVLEPSIMVCSPPVFVEQTVEIVLGFPVVSRMQDHPKSSRVQNQHPRTIEDRTAIALRLSLLSIRALVTSEPFQTDQGKSGCSV